MSVFWTKVSTGPTTRCRSTRWSWTVLPAGETGLAAARELKLDVAKLTETADSDAVRDILIGASHFLSKAGVQATPSFILGGKLMSGWPGGEGFDAALRSV